MQVILALSVTHRHTSLAAREMPESRESLGVAFIWASVSTA